MIQRQQGDVLLEEIDYLPDGCKKVLAKERGYVLAEGEATGHAHCITDVDPSICELYEKDGVLYVKAMKPVLLKHEEHHQQTIEEGIWKIGIVKEYDYFSRMSRPIGD